jgi:biopolymer transport protein ExbD
MGASVGTSKDGKSVDVELNVVPFIDLMSCLTAFLLVTAVWSEMARLDIKPKGLSREENKEIIEKPPVKASLLVTESEIWVGLSVGDRQRIAKQGDKQDWDVLENYLKELHASPVWGTDKPDLEIAAEDKVDYQTIVTAMDVAVTAEFNDIGFVDPASLSVKFKE